MVARSNSSQGQAIFEFIIFIPIILIFYAIIIWISSAINGSINQQKATRGYTYGVIKGNPMIPIRLLLEKNFGGQGIKRQGMMVFLYADKLTSTDPPQPYAECYEVPHYGEGDPENCDDRIESDDRSSPFIRVMTGYGLCGATYQNSDQSGQVAIEMDYFFSATRSGCLAVED